MDYTGKEYCFVCLGENILKSENICCSETVYHQECLNQYCSHDEKISCPICHKDITNKFNKNTKTVLTLDKSNLSNALWIFIKLSIFLLSLHTYSKINNLYQTMHMFGVMLVCSCSVYFNPLETEAYTHYHKYILWYEKLLLSLMTTTMHIGMIYMSTCLHYWQSDMNYSQIFSSACVAAIGVGHIQKIYHIIQLGGVVLYVCIRFLYTIYHEWHNAMNDVADIFYNIYSNYFVVKFNKVSTYTTKKTAKKLKKKLKKKKLW